MEPEQLQVGDFLLRKELLDRRHLHGFGLKPSGNLVYEAVWTVRRVEDGPESRPVNCFFTLEEAREWARAQAGKAPDGQPEPGTEAAAGRPRPEAAG